MRFELYVEGDSRETKGHNELRRAFRELLLRAGLQGAMPSVRACGPRTKAYRDFKIACNARNTKTSQPLPVLVVDSEVPLHAPHDKPWAHLKKQDGWECPPGATDQQAYLMVTAMESWIAADRDALKQHYGASFKEKHLPAQNQLESRPSADLAQSLKQATGDCKAAYSKGRHSFEVLAKLSPDTLRQHLPSADRFFTGMKQLAACDPAG